MNSVAGASLLTAPVTAMADVTSSAFDVSNYDAVAFGVIYGVSGDTLTTSLKCEAKLQECDTETGTFTDVVDNDVRSDVSGQLNAFALADSMSDDSKLYFLSYVGTKRWVRTKITFTGTHTYGIPVCIIANAKLPATIAQLNVANP
jgi:hypothetical protein